MEREQDGLCKAVRRNAHQRIRLDDDKDECDDDDDDDCEYEDAYDPSDELGEVIQLMSSLNMPGTADSTLQSLIWLWCYLGNIFQSIFPNGQLHPKNIPLPVCLTNSCLHMQRVSFSFHQKKNACR